MAFSFTTAALKVVVKAPGKVTESAAAVSAVYITKDDDIDPGLVFTISSALASVTVVADPNCSFYVATRQGLGAGKITWTPVDIATTLGLPALCGFINSFTTSSGSMQFHPPPVEVTSPAIGVIFRPRKRLATGRKFVVAKPIVGSALVIEGAPFVLDSPAIFLGFTITGTVSSVQNQTGINEEPGASANKGVILCDVRYLEGMEGSAAVGPGGESVGIVAGSLRKSNGEGELTVICPWTMIIPDFARQFRERPTGGAAIGKLTFSIEDTSASAADSMCEHGSRPKADMWMRGIVCIYVHDIVGRRRSWGSGIVVSKYIIATNRHVVKSEAGRVIVVFSQSNASRQVRQILSPIPNMDIAYLVLDAPYDDAEPVILASGDRLLTQTGHVTSVGFGIYSPQSLSEVAIMPLVSNGTISQVVRLPLLPHSEEAEVALISVSAACWNGSSGGGIFTRTSDRRLVGMITSNGRVDETGKIYPQLGFVIPSNVILLGWEAVQRESEVRMNDAVIRLWRMQRTHRDVHEKIDRTGRARAKL
ncbi:trypsin-like cysteine/serine peptidase domain-containing protein [Lipomyces orientalis]|uniref:Trypsin-like cysteine/serine peptidase domain-containing protein n=1 Tax=Lipomyces orientalis TaxID=1233043 RepID=A0ACC3TXW7_9ASCO